MSKKKSKISQEDLDVFHQAIEGTKPLTHGKIRLSKTTHTRQPRKIVKTDEPELPFFNFSESDYLEPIQAEEFASYKKTGVAHKILHKLRKGQYNIDAILDLHGMTVDKARIAVDGFLRQCLQVGARVALIIHGKGHHSQVPILKNKLNHWLRETDQVIAFCSAAPIHGSRGAMYILLKRNTEEKLS